MHYFPLTLPFLLIFFFLFLFLIILVEVGILGYAYQRIGVDRRYVFLLLFLSHGELRQYPGVAPACSRVPFGKGGILFRDVICHSCSSRLARHSCRGKPWRSAHPCDPLSLLDL